MDSSVMEDSSVITVDEVQPFDPNVIFTKIIEGGKLGEDEEIFITIYANRFPNLVLCAALREFFVVVRGGGHRKMYGTSAAAIYRAMDNVLSVSEIEEISVG